MPDLPDLNFEEEKESSSLFTRLKNYLKTDQPKQKVSFSQGIALLLFFCYSAITFISLPTYPILLLVLVPTMYILLRYIKLERAHSKRDDESLLSG